MNKKYCVFTVLLLSGFAVHSPTYAKPTAGVHEHQENNRTPVNGEASNTQNEQASRPKINKISFTGNTIISSAELTKQIPLKTKDVANEYVIMDSLVKIAQLYKVKNIKVTITPVLQKVSLNNTNVQFDIHEILNKNK